MATISIVSAHVATVPINTTIINDSISRFFGAIGTVGVGVFLIISGFLFRVNTKTFYQFFKGKLKTLFFPWLTTGTSVYLYVYLRKGGVSLETFLKFIIGDGSYLYFLSILIICYLLFFNLSSRKFTNILMILSVISIILTSLGYLEAINPYLNPFNWIIYFSIGIISIDRLEIKQINHYSKRWFLSISLLFLLFILFHIAKIISISYWSSFSLLFIICGGIWIFFLASKIKGKASEILIYIGKESFSIYLLHMPIAGIIVNVMNRYNIWYFTIFRPLIVIILTLLFIKMYKIIIIRLGFSKGFFLAIGAGRNCKENLM